MGNADHRKRSVEDDLRPGFLKRFAAGGLGGGFAVFHEAGRQRPETELGLDGTAAEQNPFFVLDDAADHQPWIFIVNMAAGSTNVARKAISGRNGKGNARAAVDAVTDHGNC